MSLNFSGLHRVPVIRQAENAECGLACLAMIASYFGAESDLHSLRNSLGVSTRGTSVSDITKLAGLMNMQSRAVRCELNELELLRCPAILHWDMCHFVVLVRYTRKHIIVHDPAQGRVRYLHSEVSSRFTGVAVELSRAANFVRSASARRLTVRSFLPFVRDVTKPLIQGLLLSGVLQIFAVLSPLFMQLVIDEAVIRSDVNLLGLLCFGFALLAMFEIAISIMRSLVFQYIGHSMSLRMEFSLFDKLLSMPLSYFHSRQIGDIQQRFSSLAPVQELLVSGGVTIVLDGLLGFAMALVIFIYSPVISMWVFAVLSVTMFMDIMFMLWARRVEAKLVSDGAKESSSFLETLRGINYIKMAGSEEQRSEHWRDLSIETANTAIRLGNTEIYYSSARSAVVAFGNIFTVYLIGVSVMSGSMTIGMMTAYLAYKTQLEQRFSGLFSVAISWGMLRVHLDRLADIFFSNSEPKSRGQLSDRNLSGRLRLEAVSFSYASNEEPVLNDISLEISSGEFLAIVGPSGVGKSTLLYILAGLYRPNSGKVFMGGNEVRDNDIRQVRAQVGAVLQDDTLMAGTILANISGFEASPVFERAKYSAEIAAIASEIENMPMGYYTFVGDMGSTLSGGQRQRIMLARALYRMPNLLVLDEATSNLDPETERTVVSRLRSMGVTIVAVSHSEIVNQAADRVIDISSTHMQAISR